MKKTAKITALVLAVLLLATFLTACTQTAPKGLWEENAKWKNDTELGTGAKTVTVTVRVGDDSVNLTVHTDKEYLGEALLELEIIEGTIGQYGLYVDKANGILADYSVDRTYWALYIGGSYANTGVDTTPITEGENYELVREQ